MRRFLLWVMGLTVGFWFLSGWSGAGVDADTPVVVLSASEVILHLPRSPSVDRIVSDLHLELSAVAGRATDPRIADAINRIETDDTLLEQVATSPVEMFDNGEAAATATAVYDIQVNEDNVTVVVLTVELVPGFGSTAGSREHEDGHALINESMARRCAAAALGVAVESGYGGESLINSMVNSLVAASSPVHETYHQYVRNARYGQHLRYAEQALGDVAGCAG